MEVTSSNTPWLSRFIEIPGLCLPLPICSFHWHPAGSYTFSGTGSENRSPVGAIWIISVISTAIDVILYPGHWATGKDMTMNIVQSVLLSCCHPQDFDPSGHFYRRYVKKKKRNLRPPVPPLRQYMKFWLTHPSFVCLRLTNHLSIWHYQVSRHKSLEEIIRFTLRDIFQSIDLKELDLTGFNGRAIPAVNTVFFSL